MAGLPRDKSRRMYSWWWDSHISPKNSKWLQENLTDMDTKVKAMIKLIEEDADSFAKRAEMYYKKRPELMKLVEEFYRAYRALAERYDNATGVLRQAHRTMAEVFPNQMTDDSLESTGSEVDPRTPEMSPSMRSLFGHDGLQKDALGFSSSDVHAVKRNGDYTQVSDSIANSKGMKQFNRFSGLGDGEKLAGGRVRKGLNFHDAEEKGRSMLTKDNHIPQDQVLFESEVVSKFEKEIQTLKDALAKLEVEKEAGLSQYQQSLEKLYKLESVVSHAQEDSRGLNDRANKAEGEVQALRETLIKLEAEKESSLLQYHKCLERISNLENEISHAKEDIGELNERTHKAEVEAQTLKQDLATIESEKGAALDQCNQSLEMITTLRNKLMLTDEDARKLSEQAVKAEGEVKILNLALAELTKEKEGAALQYQQCLETILILEHKLSCAENEVQRLKGEIDNGFTKLKSAEEQCFLLEKSNQSLNSELQSLVLKMGSQSEELTEKQKELGRLWTCLQEERFRFMEAETAFQTLQHLHSQTQEELRSLALELENRAQLLRDTETRNESLLDEVLKVKEDNKRFNEINLSSAISMKEMQNVIVSLRESKEKLAEEVELRVDQRNALQQEIYCLKEDLNELNKKHQVMLDQVDALGMSPEEFESSVKQLQTDNLDLKENIERERNEKEVLLEKLTIMEQLLEKNAFLEKSLSDLTSELEGARGKINALEESFQALLEEKSTLRAEKATLMSQSQVMMENLEKLSEKNNCLENSLSDVCDELEGLKARSKSLEDSCQLLEIEKSDLIDEKDALLSQGKTTLQTLEVLEKRQRELEERYSALEKERDSTICKVEELRLLLDVEKQEHVSFSQKRETQLTGMGKQISLLQDELSFRRAEFEEELDKAMHYQLEIFILQRCVQDLKEKNKSLLIECQKLLEASTLSEKLISELKHDNCEQQVEVKSLSDQTSRFRMGMCELLKAFDIDLDQGCEDKFGEDQSYFSHMLCKLEDTKSSLNQVWDENQQLDVEMSVIVTLLGQIKLEAKALKMERDMLDWQFKMKNEQLSLSLIEANKLREMNEDLSLKVSKLTALEIENSELRKIVESLKREIEEVNVVSNNKEQRICKLSEDNNLLREENQCVREENRELEVKLHQVHEEHEKTKSREGYLFSEVQLGKNEIEQWESWAASVFGELQVSSIFRALLEEKFHKLADACNLLEEEVTSKDTHIELLKERISTLEGENGGVKAQLAAHVPLIISLKDGISSLENLTWHAKLQKSHAEGVKDAELLKHQDVKSCKEVNADQEVPDALSELQDLQDRIVAVEKAVTEAAMRQIEELKYRGSSNQETVKPVSDNSEFENEILMKDIMLDQISESSSYEISRRGRAKSQSRRVESWDAADPNDSIELTVGKGKKVKSPSEKGNEHPQGEMLKRQKSKYRSSDTVVEKELGVDKLEISRTFSQRRQEVNNTKILERLNSDGQKLTNLQITVRDLKRKIEITEKSKRSKAMYECNTLKEQLEEAEEAILELFDFNGKLTRSAERKSFSSNIRSGGELEESGSSRRRRISEHARKMSEKIGRLQLEVQKIQFVLVNYENEKENKGKSRIMEMKRRVLLRDYLYGGARTPSIRRKKSTFCGCVQPPTRGD